MKHGVNVVYRVKKYTPLGFFAGGFAWDSLTLTRIDRIIDNLILLATLAVLGVAFVSVQLVERGAIRLRLIRRIANGLPLVVQFCFGSLFSAYVVFYFASANLAKTWVFVGLLIGLLITNEFFEHRIGNLYLQLALFFFVSFSFFIFFIPVITKTVGYFTFVAGGLSALLLVLLILFYFRKAAVFPTRTRERLAIVLVLALFALLNVAYLTNIIPPVPMALRTGGIYHQISRQNGDFLLTYEKPPFYRYWKRTDSPFLLRDGETVYCFASVFAPAGATTTIYHRWQWFNPKSNRWLTTDRLGYRVSGGRNGGFRGYTYKKNALPGKWRVDVLTPQDWVLGRIGFSVIKDTRDGERQFTQITR